MSISLKASLVALSTAVFLGGCGELPDLNQTPEQAESEETVSFQCSGEGGSASFSLTPTTFNLDFTSSSEGETVAGSIVYTSDEPDFPDADTIGDLTSTLSILCDGQNNFNGLGLQL